MEPFFEKIANDEKIKKIIPLNVLLGESTVLNTALDKALNPTIVSRRYATKNLLMFGYHKPISKPGSKKFRSK
jgi:hypothetical protein